MKWDYIISTLKNLQDFFFDFTGLEIRSEKSYTPSINFAFFILVELNERRYSSLKWDNMKSFYTTRIYFALVQR